MKIIVLIPKLPRMSKTAREKWLLMNFGSGVIDSNYVLILEI